jgi:hypothetical protein
MPAILVYGPSGGGKTTAIQPPGGNALPSKETFIISPDAKPLPFPNWKKDYRFDADDFNGSNFIESKDPALILDSLKRIEKRDDIKYVVLDSITHIMIQMFMDKADRKDWDKWTEFAKDIYGILNFIQSMSKNVVVIGHDDEQNDANGSRSNKVRTLGRFLDEKVEIASMFTYVFIPFIKRKGTETTYLFRTQSDGINSAKSPHGMFEYEIPNNYKDIFDRLEAYSIGE